MTGALGILEEAGRGLPRGPPPTQIPPQRALVSPCGLKLCKATSEAGGWASPRRAALRTGEGPQSSGLPPCSLPPTPPQQVISVKTGRLAVLLIIHEASSAPDQAGGQAEAGRQLQPPGRESTRLLGACRAGPLGGVGGAGARGAVLFLLPFALCVSNTQGQAWALPPFC